MPGARRPRRNVGGKGTSLGAEALFLTAGPVGRLVRRLSFGFGDFSEWPRGGTNLANIRVRGRGSGAIHRIPGRPIGRPPGARTVLFTSRRCQGGKGMTAARRRCFLAVSILFGVPFDTT